MLAVTYLTIAGKIDFIAVLCYLVSNFELQWKSDKMALKRIENRGR